MPKKLTIKHLGVLIFFVASLSFITGCALTDQKVAESTEIEPDINILRVGVTPNAPPLIFKQGKKIVGLEGHGLKVVERVPIIIEANRVNAKWFGWTRTGSVLRARKSRQAISILARYPAVAGSGRRRQTSSNSSKLDL